jgi:NAD(P)-dependent dehydrogenase (short-subunit alcohol dehydrogenase family)
MTDEVTTASRASRITSRFDAKTTALEVVAGIDLSGRSAIVTGGASGIGVETVRALASAGAQVTIAARNLQAAAAVAGMINGELGAARVSFDALELGDLASVREFARRWSEKPLSLLINNAGVMACPLGRTKDNFEIQFGTNHLGHFLLATLLVPALEAGAPSRLISLSSSGHMSSAIDFEDPNYLQRSYHPFKAYGQSKTANALFAVEYDRRHRERGVRAFSVMPGVIETHLGRHMTPELMAELGLKPPGRGEDNLRLLRKSAAQGAATSVWAATAPELAGVGGLYLEDCAEALPFSRDLPRGKGVMPHALDPQSARRLWDLSEALINTDR